MCTNTAQEIVDLKRQLAKATQNLQMLEAARREAFKDGYCAASDNYAPDGLHVSVLNQEMREAMLLRGYIPLDG